MRAGQAYGQTLGRSRALIEISESLYCTLKTWCQDCLRFLDAGTGDVSF